MWRTRIPAIAALAVVAATAGPASGDTVTTTAGAVLHGTVRPTAGGYAVHTDDGRTVEVAADDVRQVMIDRPTSRPAARGAATRPAAPARGKAARPAAVAALVEQGRAALSAGTFDAAQAAFADAVAADPTNPTANRGLGYARLRSDDAARAAPPLAAVARFTPGPPDRPLALASAAADVAADIPARAVKGLSTYLSAHASPPDEAMLNALGIALSHVSGGAANGQPSRDGQALYVRLNAALEATRRGERRWGTRWESTATVAHLTAAWHAAQRQVAEDAARVAELDHNRQAALNRAQAGSGPLGYTNYWARQNEMRADAREADSLAGQEAAAQTRLDQAEQALATTDAPTFPPAIPTDDLDLTLPPVAGPPLRRATPAAAAPAAGPGGTSPPPTR